MASNECSLQSHLATIRLKAVVGLRYPLAVERVCGYDVGTRLKVLSVNVSNDIGSGYVQYIVVTSQLHIGTAVTQAAKIRFRQAAALNHRAHGTVQNKDAMPYCFV